ncbi:MAG: pilus assembly protein CpaC [Myxococcota bacterium]|jgi:pilus assembly protein CpaC
MNRLLAAVAATATFTMASTASAQDQREDWLDIEVGKSVVLETPQNATAIAVTNPDVADIVPLAAANKIQVQGRMVGSTDLVIQLGPGTTPIIYEVSVVYDLTDLIRRIDQIVDGQAPRIYPLRERIVVEGSVSDLDTLERVALVASIYDENFINLMTVRGDHQVQLDVTFAEVDRTALRELGVNLLWGDGNLALGMTGPFNGQNSTAGNPGATGIGNQLGQTINNQLVGRAAGGATFDVTAFFGAIDLAGVLSVLDEQRLSKTVAHPTTVVLSGQQAEFLSGGEIPIPAPGGQAGQIQIEYKEYGIKLVFVPTVLANDVVDMRVEIEVSDIDESTQTRITGIQVPGFITRKAKSHLRIDDGMTFAMAGLISEQTDWVRSEIPGLGRIPLIGSLFRTVSHQVTEQELMIFVTPRLVRPLSASEIPPHPGALENNNPTDLELFLLGSDRQLGSRGEPSGSIGLER